MSDLKRWLYQFVLENRMDSLEYDQEYERFNQNILAQMEQVDSYLDKDQRRELHRLLDTIAEQNCMALERMFLASLELARELYTLVQA